MNNVSPLLGMAKTIGQGFVARQMMNVDYATIRDAQTPAQAEAGMMSMAGHGAQVLEAGLTAVGVLGAVEATGPRLYANLRPEALAGEMAFAGELAIPAKPGTLEFLMNIQNAEGGVVKWVVTADGTLIISAKNVSGLEIPHSVLVEGRPVLAAGEATIALDAEGNAVGSSINRWSGHYQVGDEALDIGVEAFRDAGITFDEVVRGDW